jgi:hypothetical protein
MLAVDQIVKKFPAFIKSKRALLCSQEPATGPFSELQSDRKVMQPILKYLLMVAIIYNSIGLINTQYRCDSTRAHAGHVML